MTLVARAARVRIGSGLLLLLFAALFSAVGGAAGTWSARAPMAPARYSHAATVLNGRIHVVGGTASVSCSFLTTLDVYDPAANAWTSTAEASMSTPRAHPGLVALDGYLYVMGGSSGCGSDLASMQRYDPVANAWSSTTPVGAALPAMSSARAAFATAVAGGRLYVIGGNFPTGSGGFIAGVEAYDPVTNTWTPQPSLPQPVSGGAVGVIDGIIYLAGGRTTGGVSSLQTYAFDPANPGAGWISKAPMPAGTSRIGMGSAVAVGKLYAIAGSGSSGLTGRVDIYDPVANSWSTTTSLPSGRTELAAAAVNDQVYAFGGFNGSVILAENLVLRTPPISTAALSPAPNGNGWNNGDVLVTVDATVAPGATVTSIVYAMSGAQSGGATVSGSTASFSVTAEGTTVVAFHAVDSLGNVEADHSVSVQIDRTLPVITDIPDQTLTASSAAGADFFFTPSATDSGSGLVSVSATPAGPLFPIGDTTVTLNALDAAGNGAVPETFVVHVLPPLHTTFVVNSSADLVDAVPGNGFCAASTGECTLRAAVQEANAQRGSDTVLVPGMTITLRITGANEDAAARGDLDVTDTNGVLTITGSGAASTVIQACDPAATPSCTGIDRLFDVQDAARLSLDGTTLRRGQSSGEGGAIRVGAHLPWAGGPGDSSELSLSNSVLSENEATNAGGAIGGPGSMTITGTTLTRNRSVNSHGGAIFANQGARLTIRNSTISDNTAVSVSDPVAGGAIFANNGALPSVTVIEGSTLSGNTASHGGGVYMTTGATLSAWNTTFSGNTATIRGGAMGIDGPAQLASVTVHGNSAPTAGAIYVHGSSLTVRNSVIAKSVGANCSGVPLVSAGHNLSDDATCALGGAGDSNGVDARLAPLGASGGPTLTHVPYTNSPLVDAANPSGCTSPSGTALSTDQRGTGFPRSKDGNGDSLARCDIGAVEDTVVPPNVPPAVSAGGPYTVDEGSAVTLTASGSDPDGDTLTYAWDLDNDNSFETPGQSVTFSAALIDGPTGRSVRVRAHDGLAGTEASTNVNVWNVFPTIAPLPVGVVIEEDTVFAGSGSFTDPGPDTWTITIDYGDGTTTSFPASGQTFAFNHVYPDPGSYMLRVTVMDDDGGDTSLTTVISVVSGNRPPAVSAGGSYTVNEGASILLTAFGSDPDGDPLSYIWDLDNNGSFETPGAMVGFTAAGLDGPSAQTVRVLATDPEGATATGSTVVNVLNVAPAVGVVTAPIAPQPVGALVTASASFSDPGVPDTFTCSVEWGDDDTSAGSIAGTVCSGSHAYTEAGVYTIRMTVRDDDNGVGSATFSYVVVYNGAGFVTGGGWLTSPAGALAATPAAAGRANFGFNAKYVNGQPQGSTQFQFQNGALNFHSTGYDWIVVSGPSAIHAGSGTINGSGDFAFLVSVVDGAAAGTQVDRFRIRIWDKTTGDVIYDDQPGDDPYAVATFATSAGRIQIHP